MEAIERLACPSPELFRRTCLSRNRPTILSGLTRDWAALERWRPAELRARFPDVPIRYETWDDEEPIDDPVDFFKRQKYAESTLSSFVDRMHSVKGPTRKFYCAQFPIFEAIPELRQDIGSLEAYMGLPRYLPAALMRRCLIPPLLWLGPAGAFSPLHFDRWDNLHVMVHGRKKWIVIPPGGSNDVYFPHARLASPVLHFSPVDAEHPDLGRFPRFQQVSRMEFVLEPGEVVFIPTGWWHHVRSLEPSVSLNFFWLRPFANALALRRYAYCRARRGILRRLGLGQFIARLEN